jgi:predicted enzyme related to lactoylglutathione lyase
VTGAGVRAEVNVSIDVPDLARGIDFYGTIFGFAEKARPFPSMAVLDAGNVTVCMHEKAEGSTPAGTDRRRYERHWTPVHLDVHVADIEPVIALVAAKGGTVERVFRSEGPRPAASCADPFGNGFCVIGARRA